MYDRDIYEVTIQVKVPRGAASPTNWDWFRLLRVGYEDDVDLLSCEHRGSLLHTWGRSAGDFKVTFVPPPKN